MPTLREAAIMDEATSFSCCLTALQGMKGTLGMVNKKQIPSIPPWRHYEQNVGEVTIGQGKDHDQDYKGVVVLHQNRQKSMLATVGAEQTGHEEHTHQSEQQARVLVRRHVQPACRQTPKIVARVEQQIVNHGQEVNICNCRVLTHLSVIISTFIGLTRPLGVAGMML